MESRGRAAVRVVQIDMAPGLLLAATVLLGLQQPAQSDDAPRELPVSIERIQRALLRAPAIRLDKDHVYRVEVLGRKPTIEDILGKDYLKGPMPAGAPTHQEILDLVTPKDYQGYAAYSNSEAAWVAGTSFLFATAQWAVQKAIHKLESAHNEREREAARKEVQDALAELDKARAKAGLPPR
jgi:hypothetical protein